MLKKYTKEDAKQFSEGNKILEEILLLCWEKDIDTNHCCAGHYMDNIDSLKAKENVEKEVIEFCMKNNTIQNISPYLSIRGFDYNENFAHFIYGYVLNETISVSNLAGWFISVRPNTKMNLFAERNEDIFNTNVSRYFSKILEMVKEYNPNIKYYSPYVDIAKTIQNIQNDDEKVFMVGFRRNNLELLTETKLNLNIAEFKDRGKDIRPRYVYTFKDNSLVNDILNELKQQMLLVQTDGGMREND